MKLTKEQLVKLIKEQMSSLETGKVNASPELLDLVATLLRDKAAFVVDDDRNAVPLAKKILTLVQKWLDKKGV